METLKVLDKEFRKYLSNTQIRSAVKKIADEMNGQLKNENILFLGVLNGAFMFTADLLRRITFNCQVSFVKLASYRGTSTSGKVQHLIGLDQTLKNKTVVILEDIVDTGLTVETLVRDLREYEPEKVMVAALFFKPEAYQKKLKIDYIGIKIPNDFVIGYGLDYNGFGRNLPDIYRIC